MPAEHSDPALSPDFSPAPCGLHALTEAFEQQRPSLHRLCSRIVGSSDADDAVQETYLLLLRHAQQIHTDLPAWLRRCAVNVARKRVRAETTRRFYNRAVSEAQIPLPQQPPPEDPSDLVDTLDTCLQELAVLERVLIHDYFYHGQSLASIGLSHGMGKTTVKNRLDKALARLHQLMQQRGIRELSLLALCSLLARRLEAATGREPAAAAVGGFGPTLIAATSITLAALATALWVSLGRPDGDVPTSLTHQTSAIVDMPEQQALPWQENLLTQPWHIQACARSGPRLTLAGMEWNLQDGDLVVHQSYDTGQHWQRHKLFSLSDTEGDSVNALIDTGTGESWIFTKQGKVFFQNHHRRRWQRLEGDAQGVTNIRYQQGQFWGFKREVEPPELVHSSDGLHWHMHSPLSVGGEFPSDFSVSDLGVCILTTANPGSWRVWRLQGSSCQQLASGPYYSEPDYRLRLSSDSSGQKLGVITTAPAGPIYMYSDDAGHTWQQRSPAELPPGHAWLQTSLDNPDTIAFLGRPDHPDASHKKRLILSSQDAGRVALIGRPDQPDASHDQMLLLSSRDAGRTWQQQNLATPQANQQARQKLARRGMFVFKNKRLCYLAGDSEGRWLVGHEDGIAWNQTSP